MGIQLGNNIRIFVTYNTNAAGVVQTSGFSTENTKQLVIQQGSLNLAQGVSYNYLADTFLDSTNNLESLGVASLDIGSIGFTTLFNSGNNGAFDSLLWNGLTSESTYPSNLWNITPDYITLKPIRGTKKVGSFGFIVFSDNLVYVLDACRVASCGLDLSMNQFVTTNWNCSTEHLKVLTGCSIQDLGNSFNVTGALTGSFHKLVDSYKVAASNLVRVGVSRAGGTDILGYIATTGTSLNFSNSLNYIDNNWIDRSTISKLFIDAGTYTLDGTMSFYARNSNSYSSVLTTEILSNINNATVNPLYKLTIQILSDGTSMCDIILDSCNLSVDQEFGTAISNTLSFKVVKSNFDTNCSIKFYT